MKTCTSCKKPYPDELFIGDKGKPVKKCHYCRERHREGQRRYREANPEKINERRRRHYEANRERISERRRRRYEANCQQAATADLATLFPHLLAQQIEDATNEL